LKETRLKDISLIQIQTQHTYGPMFLKYTRNTVKWAWLEQLVWLRKLLQLPTEYYYYDFTQW